MTGDDTTGLDPGPVPETHGFRSIVQGCADILTHIGGPDEIQVLLAQFVFLAEVLQQGRGQFGQVSPVFLSGNELAVDDFNAGMQPQQIAHQCGGVAAAAAGPEIVQVSGNKAHLSLGADALCGSGSFLQSGIRVVLQPPGRSCHNSALADGYMPGVYQPDVGGIGLSFNGQLAIEGKPYAANVRLVDTRHVSVGQCAVVAATARWLKDHPDATLEEAAAAAESISAQTQMCFVPRNLDYLRAGGRCSNATALVGNLLRLHPCIEIIDGKLIAGKKYRGDLAKLASALLKDFSQKHELCKEHLYFIRTPYMGEDVRAALDDAAEAMGFRNRTWIKTGCVITCHGGPGAFGIVGTTE